MLVITFMMILAVSSFFSWQARTVPVPAKTDSGGTPASDYSLGSKPPASTLEGQWICGNGVADPGEDCLSCPRDVEECSCSDSQQGTFEKAPGESFFLCSGQKAQVDGVWISLLSPLSHKLGVNTPDGYEKALLLEEGETADVWYWSENVLHSYELTLESKITNGARLAVDYPRLPPGQESTLNNGQKAWLGDTRVLIYPEFDSTNGIVTLTIFQNNSSTTRTLAPGETLTIGDDTLECVSIMDGGVTLVVNGGVEP